MIRDEAFRDVLPAFNNFLLRYNELNYFKSYNIFKNHYSSSLKNYQFFNNSFFEGLAYSESLINEFHQTNFRSIPRVTTRYDFILRFFFRIKDRVRAFFEVISDQRIFKNIGVRQKYRINMQIFFCLFLNQLFIVESEPQLFNSPALIVDMFHRPF